MTEHVSLFEMGPRDGLQNEKSQIATADKIELVNQLSDCGFSKIEVTSFVSPKWVPQMSDATEVMAGITRKENVAYAVLTPNMRGFEGAVAAEASEVAVFGSASEGFSRKNINVSIEESLDRFRPVAEAANAAGIPVRGYISCVTGCPYDGATPPEIVAWVAAKLLDLGCYEISLGDTIGMGTPDTVATMLDAVLEAVSASQLAGHFHDTRGIALDNISVCLEKGLRSFDSSIAGLGGCPYVPGAKGNVATENVAKMLDLNGFKTGLDLDKLATVAEFASTLRS